ncbi:MAG: TetR/AcrR family transcriptional regulator [Rhodobacteraceae bacterium]|nr:TetR/AcrR family transcriptional regulator [Paracoccaceae bacterium]MCF8516061.1 TetR/AcrR family transcriptional regulator [Paracoccaceae bacterium]MCF8520400.1 TetR/AcrR family transcriptional regulator [Paracoccaceae bacterium]
MTGLRARQKADRSRRMLESASRLFREQGYGVARIEDIAAAAEVSVGTLYNYFGTKGDVLLATVSMEVEDVLSQGHQVVANPTNDIAEALGSLIRGYYEHSLVYLTKEMWRTAMALSIDAPDSPFARRYTELDALLCDQVCALVQRLQSLSLVQAEYDSSTVGAIIFNDLNAMFTQFVRVEDMTLEALLCAMKAHNETWARLLER